MISPFKIPICWGKGPICLTSVFFLGFLSSPVLAADSLSGHKLLSMCLVTASDRASEKRFASCEKFVRDVRRELETGAIHGIRACIPKEIVDINLLIQGVAALEQSEEHLHEAEAHSVLAEFYARKWPC